MAFGQATVTLRPLKFATLVELADRDALLEAIRINTFLWGGTYNPIIPIFPDTPGNWSYIPLPPPPAEILIGYIRFFDPDILVTCGKIDPSKIETQGRMIVPAGDITKPISASGIPGYGVGLPEILDELGRHEFKFVRRDELKVLAPTLEVPTDALLAAIFGDIPAEAGEIYEHCLKYVDTHRPAISIDNFFEFHSGQFLFRRQVCSHGLEVRLSRTARHSAIFYFDHTDPLDLIDYWNLRAVGWEVMPLPKAVAQSEKAKSVAGAFISEHKRRDTEAPHFEDHVSIVKGRSISQEEHQALVESLCESPAQIMCQFRYPPMWDEFTHMRGHLDCAQLVADTRTTIIDDDISTLQIAALAPAFMAPGYRQGYAYANDLEISRYGLKGFGTAVIPPDQQTVARLFGFGLPDDWRIGANGLTFLGHHADWAVQLSQPSARDVVASVLKSRGWTEFKISPPGNIAYQMMRHLGGPYGINLLKSRRLIEYLERLSRSGTWDLRQTFFAEIKKIAEAPPISIDVHRLIERYTDAKIFTLGLEVLCPVCTQRSWYALDTADYEVQFPKCLSSFKLPIHNPSGELKWAYKNLGPFTSPPDGDEPEPDTSPPPETQWAYRSLGPFAAPKRGGGAYSVLLTVNFLAEYHHPATTTALSFTAKGHDGKALEADFMMFYRNAAFWERSTEWVFGECKTFNKFRQRDIDRMQLIAESFPDAVLVVATLADDFADEEKALLLPFVNACRAYGKLNRPSHGVLLLTGTELFSTFGPPSCWQDKPGKGKQWAEGRRPFSSLLELCDATQTLYLGLEPWSVEWQAEFERRREAAKGITPT
jgi:hypothetical protein